MKRAVVVFNRRAGAGRAERVAELARRALASAGWDVRVRETLDRGGATPVARELAREVGLLAVVGGDGSLREAVVGLGRERSHVTLGLLPNGNANVVARELGIPLDAGGAVQNLLEGEVRALDLGHADDVPFLGMVGVGWDAQSVRLLDRVRGTALGRRWYRLWADSVYVAVGLLALCRPFPPRFKLKVDGAQLADPFCALVVGNCRTYGKDWRMTPDASPYSGRLDYQARKRSFVLFAVWHLLAAVMRRKSPRFISVYGSGQEVLLRSERPVPAQVDGDFLGYVTELRVSVEPAAVRIVCPRGAPVQGTRNV